MERGDCGPLNKNKECFQVERIVSQLISGRLKMDFKKITSAELGIDPIIIIISKS